MPRKLSAPEANLVFGKGANRNMHQWMKNTRGARISSHRFNHPQRTRAR
jgi:hypothetical protein